MNERSEIITNVGDLDLPEADLIRPMNRDEWRTTVANARAHHPWLIRTPLGYSITSHEDVVGILRDRRFHSALSLIPQMQGMSDNGEMNRRPSILSVEGDTHSRLRRLVAPAFTPKAADRMRPFMQKVIGELVDVIAPNGRSEFVADICEPYPIPIICELLGAPRHDWRLFSKWATDLLAIFNGNLAEDLPRIMAARAELDVYMGDLIDERRRDPRPDLLSDLISAHDADDRLTRDELVSMAEAVLVAGTDTTRNQLACAVAVFAEHSDQWALLASSPELAPRAVEEVMRYLGAVRGTARVASVDIEYRDVMFPAGTLVFPSFLAANFDESRWTAPERFDVTKESASVPQLTFGSGIHYCLGAWLARAELQEALPLLARRLPDLALDGDITWKSELFGIWGPERLPIRFTAGR